MNQLLDLAMALIISPRQALMEITNEEKLKEGFSSGYLWCFSCPSPCFSRGRGW